ncbi:hypothetical protein [Longimicrobium sp.]|uniref:hypothetical protein n=1 Tax=Longimicrobium sp. TaxID=2029185 RepID=UPI002BF64EF4|nr:hypothetical protein [Longimicrobium sp.]HSU12871.1 hypothetical protein [Longimicrobium sp.]
MTTDELRRALEQAWDSDREHVERLTLAAAVLQTALREAGMEATLVGGGAIEFYIPDAYTTSDIDLVVERQTREALDDVFTSLGLTRRGRHWVRGELFVEVPGNYMAEPTEEFTIGPMTLRVVRKEYVLADRVIGFRHWKYWAYGVEAIEMIRALGSQIDEAALRAYLRKEGSEHAYDLLREIMASGEPLTEQTLEARWHREYR